MAHCTLFSVKSIFGEEYTVDPVKDLRPVCPNCHAVVHLRIPAFSIEEIRAAYEPDNVGITPCRDPKIIR